MSVLDMFASALGAFIMISVILFPFYNQAKQLEQARDSIKKTNDHLGKVQAELLKSEETSRTQLEQIRRGSEFRTSVLACEQTMSACKASLTKVFLAIGMEWEESCDVDIYITDPAQRQFYYSSRKIPPSKAELSIDMLYGPGIEVWQNPEAETGDYKVHYKKGGSCPALASGADTVTVKGWLIDRSGGIRLLPEMALTQSNESADVAIIHVSADGLSSIRPADR